MIHLSIFILQHYIKGDQDFNIPIGNFSVTLADYIQILKKLHKLEQIYIM